MSNLNPSHPSIEGMDRVTTAAKQLRSRTLRDIAARINSNLKLTRTTTRLLCAFAIAAGAFWATMVTSPPNAGKFTVAPQPNTNGAQRRE